VKKGFTIIRFPGCKTSIMTREKIVDRADIKEVIAGENNKGRKIVFTNGCFDLIHIGHVRYLSEAKRLGDILVIGLNADKSISRIKPGRPVTPEAQRAEVLSALAMVDYIVLFSEDTPYELIKEVRPHVLVKGADWEKDDIVGNDIVKDVRTIPFTEGISTTGILKKIQDLKDQ
jgi:D-beta-D-heptose 7-phosphate kinase/D-beta-D-heptose 1-phosphate adenosyltransferase